MVALTSLTCLTLDRRTFIDILGPLQDIMAKEKSEEVRQGGQGAEPGDCAQAMAGSQ